MRFRKYKHKIVVLCKIYCKSKNGKITIKVLTNIVVLDIIIGLTNGQVVLVSYYAPVAQLDRATAF